MLILYSPLPSAKTGTAAYTSALLEELLAYGGDTVRESTIVAVDGSSSEDQGAEAKARGWKVQDYRGITVGSNDLCVYFLASNSYHYYCYEQLAVQARGRIFGVIHDLTASFFIREMSEFLGSPYAGSLDQAFQYDFSTRTKSLLRDYEKIHEVARQFVSAQGITLKRCDMLVVHSQYAKAKLLLETGAGAGLQERIAVCAHPVPCTVPFSQRAARVLEPAGRNAYRVGSLGYYSHMKRYPSVVSAWSDFLVRYRVDAPCELLLGGDIPRRERRRLLDLCDEKVRHTIKFVGFLDDEGLHDTIRSLDLAIALRFPSCGETSGLVAHCLAYKTPIVVSEFAAFREEPAAFRISVSPEYELQELTTAIKKSFDAWSKGIRLASKPPTWSTQKSSIAHLLLEAST